ncbi:hypothetical protein T492DRAFT_893134, partial [Pavlovales sp. CCMP2436]
AIRKIGDARACLDKWSKTYLAFDKKKLFDRTNYMKDRCADLAEVAELKAVTGDAQGIDETVPFDIFDKRYQVHYAK